MPTDPLIQLSGLSKHFGGVTALDEVSFDVRRGEVHAIVGENGAGKSTLMKLLAGVHTPDRGEIKLGGRLVRLKSPREAQRHGISIVYQELNLFPHRTVTANIFANRESRAGWGRVNRPAMREATRAVLREMGVQISPDVLVGTLDIGEKQLVEIARMLQQQSRIIILDEPNSALNETESKRLFEILRGLRARGITIIYISHRLEEVFAIADRITVIRDGRYQGTFETADITIPQIITTMIGRPLHNLFPERPIRKGESEIASNPASIPTPQPPVLQVHEVVGKAGLGPISFTARPGEIVGFAGLEGAGVDELFGVLFGLEPMRSGKIWSRGQLQQLNSPQAAMRAGWALIPASRRDQGLLMDWSIGRNMTLLVLDKLLGRHRLIDSQLVSTTTQQYLRQLSISAENHDQPVSNLSGGNQQKVLLGKWLATAPTILLLNNPTRGVDVGAKWEIYEICQKLAADGMTILMTSGEVEEILGLSDRVLVLSKGKLLREFRSGQVTKAELLHAMSGHADHVPTPAPTLL